MAQIHKRFTLEQIRMLFLAYEKGHISREEIENTLDIGKTRFFALIKQYRENPETFSIEYQRSSKSRLPADTEEKIKLALLDDKELVDNKELPIDTYNYAALNDRLKKEGIQVSTTTIIKRAKSYGCYIPIRKSKDHHDREVITSSVGELIQHDASHHKWSPFADNKWVLITSLDDYSRMLMYADFVETETSWAHIQAAQYLMHTFGIPHRYYVDNLRVFRFIQHRDSTWKKLILGTDDVITQWRQVMDLMKTDVIFALSPQAKGKIERPYRWLQDRIVRACALNKIDRMQDARIILREEIHRYNHLQVHSTTKEIPVIRYEKALTQNRSLLRPFALPLPFSSPKDVFCIHQIRTSDGYRKISIGGQSFQIPTIEPRDDVELHFVPVEDKNLVEIRVWSSRKLVHTINLPISELQKVVHF